MNHFPMTSTNPILKQRFPSTYQTFFADHIAISGQPCIITSDMHHPLGHMSHLTIHYQQLPYYFYIGISPQTEWGIQIGTLTHYSPVGDNFSSHYLRQKRQQTEVMQQHLNQLAQQEKTQHHMRIDILSELPFVPNEIRTNTLTNALINAYHLYTQRVSYLADHPDRQWFARSIPVHCVYGDTVVTNTNSDDILIGDYCDIITHPYPILFDTIAGKIFVNGEKVWTKDLHTQSTSIEILLHLLQQRGTFVHNSELARSSYAKSRNQITSKVIGPFKHLIRKRFNKEIKLICSWSLYDFSLLFDPGDLPISVAKRVGK